ncbi:hypothetical protein [Kitasatospora cineracea]|uniref:hypothetical protein n=1 Tax=Kitasatospora cineracea TaxID=88074 RepID=UPI00380B8368
MAYRYWCGECDHRTPWLDQPRAAQQLLQHYARHHPAAPPGGRIETTRRTPGTGPGCLAALAALALLLAFAAARRH